MIQTRNATLQDLAALVELGEMMRAESVEPFPPVEPARVQAQLEMTIESPEFFMAAVAEVGAEMIGMVTAAAGDYAFSTERRSFSDLLFVRPDRRGFVAARRLIRHFIEWSDRLGARTNIMGISTGIQPERTGKLFELHGFRSSGQIYRRDVV